MIWWRCQHLGQVSEEGLWLLQEMDRWGSAPISPSICSRMEVEGDGLAEAVGSGLDTVLWALQSLQTVGWPCYPMVCVWPQAKLAYRWEWAKLSEKHLHSKNNSVLSDPSKHKILKWTTLLFPSLLESKAQTLRTHSHICLQCDSEYPVWD